MKIRRVETKKTYWNPRGVLYLVETDDGKHIDMYTKLKDAKEFVNMSDTVLGKLYLSLKNGGNSK